MSNNLVSQPLSVANIQMDPASNNLDSSMPSMRTGAISTMSSTLTQQQFKLSNMQNDLLQPMSSTLAPQNLPGLNKQMRQMEAMVNNPGLQPYLLPNQQIENMGTQKVSLPIKRSSAGEPLFNNVSRDSRHLSILNKHGEQVESMSGIPGFQQQASAQTKKIVQANAKTNHPDSLNLPSPNKKMVRNDPISGRSGPKQLQVPRNRTIQMESSPNVKNESFESVRSKMRESLAAALALVAQNQDKCSNEEKNSGNDAMMTEGQTVHHSQTSGLISPLAGDSDSLPSGSVESLTRNTMDKGNCGTGTSQGIPSSKNMGDSAQTWRQEVQCNTLLSNENVPFGDSFFAKDELLQGNGLTWAFDVTMDVEDFSEIQAGKKPKLAKEDEGGERKEQEKQSPLSLASKIEAELFKLFGGVNKKYKEKGRSLLFNLKDRNNPELREKVMSSEITPERLCSMTAEELASKELSQWRIAKAEELAQMVVLPDSDVDIRRLVKKTHKGEFQVEVEQDDGASVEVSVGATTSSFSRVQSKNSEMEGRSSSKSGRGKEGEIVGAKSSSENQDISDKLTILNDGTDLMQGLMVDEFKDADLPPIVSLDEFMESLDAEPPFENLPMDAEKMTSPSSPSNKEHSDVFVAVTASDLASKDSMDRNSNKSDKTDDKETDSDLKTKPSDEMYSDSDVKIKPRKEKNANLDMRTKSNNEKYADSEASIEHKCSAGATSKIDAVWEGSLQMSVSALVTMICIYKSGEKASTNEWTSSLEIKGRVRLDAFEKFIQELPMSRSRAVMVAHYVLKEDYSEGDGAILSEAVNSYLQDERLGFAEPATGVEVYFCPPHPRIRALLNKHLSRDQTETIDSIDNGLIGVVVWRKPHLTSAISPSKTSSSHKHASKRHQPHLTARRQEVKEDSYVNAHLASRPNMPLGPPPGRPLTQTTITDDEDEDVPPGFGPGAATRDDDDLPEFNFTSAQNTSLPKVPNCRGPGPMAPHQTYRPVDQVRELIQKYGQNPFNVGFQPWNDDDDDIPEWQPQALPSSQPQSYGFRQPLLPRMVNQLQGLAFHGQLPAVEGGGARWMPPPGHHGVGTQPPGYYEQPPLGMNRGPEAAPRSRGF